MSCASLHVVGNIAEKERIIMNTYVASRKEFAIKKGYVTKIASLFCLSPKPKLFWIQEILHHH